MAFLNNISHEVLNEINYPIRERKELIKSFEPLELLLRTALSLKTYGDKSINVRDHLSHTVRNVLFTNYLLGKFTLDDNSSTRRKLFIAAIFHDIAYPIEKLKKIAKKLGDATFKELLNSKGHIEIELDNPDDLLEMLHYLGNITIIQLQEKIKKAKDNLQLKLPKEDKDNLEVSLQIDEQTLQKLQHVYTEIVSKAIAGIGLFDASHSISSVVLFLRPILKYWKHSGPYQEINLGPIVDICLAMTYHDRNNLIQNIDRSKFKVPLILRLMRISDELQEWDRENNSFIEDVKILYDPVTLISLEIKLKNKGLLTEDKCLPELFLPDKIEGILPALEKDEVIKLMFFFPEKFDLSLLNIEKKFQMDVPLPKTFVQKIELLFTEQKVDLSFDQKKKYCIKLISKNK
jgi:hypothetical protein